MDLWLRSITVSDLEISAGEYIWTRREYRGVGSVAAFLAIANEIAQYQTGRLRTARHLISGQSCLSVKRSAE